MGTVEYTSPLNVSPDTAFTWHARAGAFERLTPPWAPVRLEQFEGIWEGDRAVLRMGPGPLALRWVAEHHDVINGRQFCDRQVQGPFSHWDHTHRFEPLEDRCRLVDHIEYELPGGGWTDALEPWLEPELHRQFAYRHRVTEHDLELHQEYNSENRALTVGISGSSGLIGSQLVSFLTTGGHDVKRLVRSAPIGEREILWDPVTQKVETEKLEGLDALIHLAGEPVFGFWTAAKTRRIYDSRVTGTRLLAEALTDLDDPPDVFISASGVNYYGDHGADRVTEQTPSNGDGFLAQVCQDWEAATAPAATAGIRTVHARLGIVLSPAGGALKLQMPVFWLGLGGVVGSGRQYVPWIALDDVLGGLYHLLYSGEVQGPVNLTAPTPVSMNEYAETLATVLNRPAQIHIPAPVLRSVAGEIADELILPSLRVVPNQLQKSGYEFGYRSLDAALRHVLGR